MSGAFLVFLHSFGQRIQKNLLQTILHSFTGMFFPGLQQRCLIKTFRVAAILEKCLEGGLRTL